MPDPLPPVILRLLERRLPPRLAQDVAGDLAERWQSEGARSRMRAWCTVVHLTASVLWHAAAESRRQRSPSSRTTGGSVLTGLSQDVRFTWRLAVRQPWLSAAAVATISLGIAATTAIFSVLHAWILTPLPYRDPDRLVAVWETVPSASIFENTPAPATVEMWKARARSFAALAPFTAGVLNLTGVGEPAQLDAARVSPELLPLLGVSPALGRNFTGEEGQIGRPAVAILTHRLWTSRFGARTSVVGEVVQLSGVPTTIVGVLPSTITVIPFGPDIWVPLRMTAEEAGSTNRILWVIGRLADGVTPDAATRELENLTSATYEGIGARAVPLHDQTVGPLSRDIAILFAATAFVLLIACANVASLTLARITGRQQEILVRVAVGAGRRRIARQMLTESVAVGIAGAAGGLLLAGWAIRALVALSPDSLGMPAVTLASPAVFLFALGAATTTSMLFGLGPAIRSASLQIGSAMREGSATVAGGRQRILRGVVAAEVALALALLAGAGLVVRSYRNLTAVDLGFDVREVVAFQVPRPAGEPRERSLAFFEQLQQALAETSGIRSVGLIQALPLRSMAMGASFAIEGRVGDDASILSYWRIASADYFQTLGIPLVQGRPFDRRDRDGAEKVAIVTESFARRAWPDGIAIGKRIGWGTFAEPLTVVGVVGDVRLMPSIRPGPHVYMPFEQVPHRLPHELVVRSDAGTAATVAAVRRVVWALDGSQPVAGIATLESLLDDTLRRRRFQLTIFAIAAGMALILAVVGIYGVLSYAAGQMASEFGVRIALGASSREIGVLVLRMGLAPVAVGVAAGAVLSWWTAGVLRGFLFGIDARDPLTFLCAAALLGAAATAACALPARRAAVTDPLLTIRNR